MFSNLREKLFNVQEEITTSLRSLKLDRHGLRRVTPTSRGIKDSSQDSVNLEAGAELLEKYTKIWLDIHRKTEEAAASGGVADNIISRLHKSYEEEWAKVGQLTMTLAHMPKVLHGVREISDRILNIQCAFDETEEALLNLENMIETQELREKELEHRFQLALYQEKRTRELEDLKVKLTEEHLSKLSDYEKKRLPEMKERQAAFQSAFQEDLQNYREGNLAATAVRVVGSESAASTPTLEEIELEEDPFVLEEFLADEDEGMEQSNTTTTTSG